MADIELKSFPRIATKRRGRGPGSGVGGTSGRGHKGQKARSGGGVRPGFEGGQMPLYRRLPKRGFTNIFRKDVQVVHLSALAKYFKSGEEVTPASLAAKKLISARKNSRVKILRDVEKFDLKLAVNGPVMSAGAKELVEKAGGTYVAPVTAEPVAPAKPVVAAKPVAPAKSDAPVKPDAPLKPVKPSKPAASAKPAAPEKPAKHEKPGAGR